jgi:NAD-dependent deacetylase sirtuin 5
MAYISQDFKKELQKAATVHIKRSQKVQEQDTDVPPIYSIDLKSFQQHLQQSHRILALFSAGLSAPSGISTFRSSNSIFRGYDLPMLTTVSKFVEDPILSWWYFSSRRSAAMRAAPNEAHYALANLGNAGKEYLAITQNIDGV